VPEDLVAAHAPRRVEAHCDERGVGIALQQGLDDPLDAAEVRELLGDGRQPAPARADARWAR
jgi:hypothetical protein